MRFRSFSYDTRTSPTNRTTYLLFTLYACKISHNHFDHTLLFLLSFFIDLMWQLFSCCFSIARRQPRAHVRINNKHSYYVSIVTVFALNSRKKRFELIPRFYYKDKKNSCRTENAAKHTYAKWSSFCPRHFKLLLHTINDM